MFLFVRQLLVILILLVSVAHAESSGPVIVLDINGTINPATDDYLKSGIREAEAEHASLVIVRLNTPGGLLPSMQSMVQQLLDSPVPVAVYVTPGGASATSAGVFITMAGHFAAMAPGTTIGAAHPVSSGGETIEGDARAKIENFSVSLARAIAEQRGRNTTWAEKAVRESVSITDRDALADKVIDVVASDLTSLLDQIKSKTITVKGAPVTVPDLRNAPRKELQMSFKQKVVNVLSDPNVAMFLGLGAMAGIGIELYHPGLILPGVIGVICLVLSLTAAQVLPINYGGLALFVLGIAFIVIETLTPGLLIWGVAGIACLVLGSIYLIDTDLLWGMGSYALDYKLVGTTAAAVGTILLTLASVAVRTFRAPVKSGSEGLIGSKAKVISDFEESAPGIYTGRVQIGAEIWKGEFRGDVGPKSQEELLIADIGNGMTLILNR